MNGDPGEWIVLFHGTKNYQSAEGIINEGLKPGINNVYHNSICRFSNSRIP